MEILWIVLIVLAVLFAWIILTYNSLIHARNRVREGWSDIEVQLERRHNLIPNLVETVKGYAAHEEGVLTKVTQARTAAMSATTPAEHAAAENMLTGALKTLFAVSENYPQLRASENFLNLQQNLTDAEDKIQAARRFYNGQVRDFNTKLQVFPNNVIATPFGFKAEEFFDAVAGAEKTPEVKF